MKHLFTIFLLSLLPLSNIYSTGPSYIKANIQPIAINDKGDILCRTRFTHNDMGAHSYMEVIYGYCILTNNSIIELQNGIFKLSPLEYQQDEPDDYYQKMQHHDSLFYSDFGAIDTDIIVTNTLKKKYKFFSCDMDKYKTDKIYSISELPKMEFKKKKITSLVQKSLKGGKSIYEPELIHRAYIMYDFGHILLLKNRIHTDCVENDDEYPDNNCFGTYFDYINPIFGDQNIEYETIDITGVIFL